MLRNNPYCAIFMAFMLFYVHSGAAQNAPTLVKDILVGGTASSYPHDFLNFNNETYFTIFGANGSDEWLKTNGTAAGTVPVKYTPPRPTRFGKALSVNGILYVLLIDTPNNTAISRIILARTNLITTTIIDTIETPVIYPRIRQFFMENGKFVIMYGHLTGSGAGETKLIIHKGTRNGTLLKQSIANSRAFNINFKTYLNAHVAFVDESYSGRVLADNYTAILSIPNNATGAVPTPIFKQILATTPPAKLLKSFGIINDKLLVSIGDTLAQFSVTGVRTNVRIGIGATQFVASLGNQFYFSNHRNELWKTDGSAAGTVKLNSPFEDSNELITNLLGGGTSPYVMTQSGTIVRTYFITPQDRLSRVNFNHNVSYFKPFVSKGVQYIFSRDSTNTPTDCPIISLVRYEQTEAQSKFFELRDKKLGLCDSKFPEDVLSILSDNDVLYYNMETPAFSFELWKLDLKTTPNSICASKSVAPWELWLSNVKLGTINNTSAKFKNINTLGFSDYTNLSTSLAKGQKYPLSITPSSSWAGNLAYAYCRIWIDFNKNNVFETNELVLEKTGQGSWEQTVSIPNNALTGATRMRVSLKQNSYPTPCETFPKGEVEDYTINITSTATTQPLAIITPLNAMLYDNKVKLDWVQTSDKVAHFEIQKPTADGLDFQTIHQKRARLADNYYMSYDELPVEGLNDYRLKTVLKDSSILYSPIQRIDYQQLASFTIFPNPAQESTFLDLKDFENKPVEISISDVAGKTVWNQSIENASALPHSLEISTLKNGTYLLHIQTIGKRPVVRKLHVLN